MNNRLRCTLDRLIAVSILAAHTGCGQLGGTLVDRSLFCRPSNNPAPDCITDNIRSIPTGHVLILPGIGGATDTLSQILGLEGEVDDLIDRESLWSSQVWDWTQRASEVSLFSLNEDLPKRLFEKEDLHQVAARLARMICEWRARPVNEGKSLSILAGSGGALIALLACQATDAFGDPVLPEDFRFHSVVLASPALSGSRSIRDLAERSERGVFVYYSSNDGTLLGGTCPNGVSFDFPWPAQGKFGYPPGDPNAAYVAGQLGWVPAYIDFNNSGQHLACYRSEFFREFLLPVVTDGAIPPEWHAQVESEYLEPSFDLVLDASLPTCDLEVPGCLENTGVDPLVVILPGHEGVMRERTAQNIIEDELGIIAQIWDWTAIPELDDLEAEERRSSDGIAVAALRFASALRDWRANNSGHVHLLAGSSGALVSILACEARNDNGSFVISEGSIESVVFSSATHSTYRPLTRLAACTRNGIYNYYSALNQDAVGEVFCDHEVPDNANIDEALLESIMATVANPVPWPAAGRFGYRSLSNENLALIAAQLGWNERLDLSGNSGEQFEEYDRDFFQTYFLPIFSDGERAIPANWQKEVAQDYEDVDTAFDGVSLAREVCTPPATELPGAARRLCGALSGAGTAVVLAGGLLFARLGKGRRRKRHIALRSTNNAGDLQE